MAEEPAQADLCPHWSHQRTARRFDSVRVAAKYPARDGDTFRERRERACLLSAMRRVAPGSSVLDLPCGTGRLIPLLVGCGFQVTAADVSPHMVEAAKKNWHSSGGDPDRTDRVRFEVRDVMATGYAERQFDAVFCNRLFHHFNDSQTRVAALCELRRIARGPVVVSFFNSFALDAVRFRLRHFLRGSVPTDRIPIRLETFAADVTAAGLTITATIPVLWGLSPMWYIVAQPQPAHGCAEHPARGRQRAA